MNHIFDVLNDLKFLDERRVAVGGSVRDYLLGDMFPHDIDVAVPTSPEVVMAQAQAAGYFVIPTGIKHGTVTIMLGEQPVEVTTFRQDFNQDGRHADVVFVGSLEEDLARRDFTINAMALTPQLGLIDPFGGAKDLRHRELRAVGNATERMTEDYLRILRALRFQAKFDMAMDDDLVDAVFTLGHMVPSKVSAERIVDEFNKAFRNKNIYEFLWNTHNYGILQEMLPQFTHMERYSQHPVYHPEGSVFAHILKVVLNAPPEYRWHALLHDIGKPDTAELKSAVVPSRDGGEEVAYFFSFHGHENVGAEMIPDIADRFRFSNDLAEEIYHTTRYHMQPLHIWRNIQKAGWFNGHEVYKKANERAKRRFQASVGKHLEAVKQVVYADRTGREGPTEAFLEWLFDPLHITSITPALMGRHLIERGWKPGPLFTPVLKVAFEYQLDTGESDIESLYAYATARGVPGNVPM